MKGKRVVIGFILSFLSLVLFIIPSGANQGQKDKPVKSVTQTKINRAIKKGIAYLKKQQGKKGEWVGGARLPYEIGATALVVYTLLKCGLSPKDKTVARSLNYLLDKPLSGPPLEGGTYRTSIIAMAMATALEKGESKKSGRKISKKYYQKLKDAVDWLIKAQNARGVSPIRRKKLKSEECGSWGYTLNDLGYFDNSNTQFALLGLRAAQNVHNYDLGINIKVPESVWKKAFAHLVSTQNKDGGWAYNLMKETHSSFRDSYGSMTAAGICGMIICLGSLEEKPDLDKIIKTKEISNAIKWLGKDWDIKSGRTPFSKKETLHYYWLYSLERACMLGGIKKIGNHNWYQEGAAYLIKAQNQGGNWSAGYRTMDGDIVSTCFALLFLKRAYMAVITPSGRELKPIITPSSKDKPGSSDKSPESSPKGNDKK